MRFSYTSEEIEAWRAKVQRRTSRLAVKNKAQAFRFIQNVGFCFAFRADRSESPYLWHAATGRRHPLTAQGAQEDPYMNLVWEMESILVAERKVYYGKLLRDQATMVSLEFLPYFYALSRRSGTPDEHLTEYAKGNLSCAAKAIMDALCDSSPQVTGGLKLASGLHTKADRQEFDKALKELQKKMFIVKIAEHDDLSTFEWETVPRRFPRETKRSRRISEEQACQKILQKYFENQLVGTVASIQGLFGWDKQIIFRTLGHLKSAGVITPDVLVDGSDGKYYGLVY